MPPKKKSVRGAVSSFELCMPFIGIMPPPCCSLFRKKRGRPKKTDDDYDARLKTPKDVSARNKAGKEDKPRHVLHLTAKHAVSSDKHGVLGTNAPFLSRLLLVFPFPFPCPFPSFPQVSSLSSSSL